MIGPRARNERPILKGSVFKFHLDLDLGITGINLKGAPAEMATISLFQRNCWSCRQLHFLL